MATVKIKQIKRTTAKALAYITNAEKTDGGRLVSGFNADPESASMEFDFTYALAKNIRGDYGKVGGANIKAYHMIQSFAIDDDITAEKAHELGRRWADELLDGKHEYVIATHIDKKHLHNHIIFNATSYYDFKKFQSIPYKTIKQMRTISDKLCKENNLSVVKSNNRSKDNGRYEKTESLRDKLTKALDDAISKSESFSEFKALLKMQGVEIKEGKHLSFKHPDGERFLRGKNLPGDYSLDKITEKISLSKVLPEEKEPLPYHEKLEKKSRKTLLAETQELAKTLLIIRQEKVNSFADFSLRQSELKSKCDETKNYVSELEKKNKQYGDAAKYLIAYNDTLSMQKDYESCSRFKQASFYKSNKNDLDKHAFALKKLNQMKVNLSVDPEKVIGLVDNQNKSVINLRNNLTVTEDRINQLIFAQQIAAQIESESKNIKNKNISRSKTL